MNTHELIRDKTYEVFRKAREIYCIPFLDPVIYYDLRGTVAGRAGKKGSWFVRYNMELAERNIEDFLNDTVIHECAHVIAFIKYGRIKPHGYEWRSVCSMLGLKNPKRCHDYEVTQARKTKKFAYTCSCGTKLTVGLNIYNKMQGGRNYRCCSCRIRLNPTDFLLEKS